MSDNVKKIFTVLIVVVALILVGAMFLNVILPNVATTVVDAVEDSIYKATGLSFDFNGNGVSGSNKSSYTGNQQDNSGTSDTQGNSVVGFN